MTKAIFSSRENIGPFSMSLNSGSLNRSPSKKTGAWRSAGDFSANGGGFRPTDFLRVEGLADGRDAFFLWLLLERFFFLELNEIPLQCIVCKSLRG